MRITRTHRKNEMKSQTDETIDILNDLIETCGAGAEGFEAAAEAVEEFALREVFVRCALQRRNFVAELRKAVRQHGGEVATADKVLGKLHRGWMDIRKAVSTKEAHAILAECERGEDEAVKSYREALEKTSEPDIREVVTRQFVGVKASHDAIRDLRDSAQYRNR